MGKIVEEKKHVHLITTEKRHKALAERGIVTKEINTAIDTALFFKGNLEQVTEQLLELRVRFGTEAKLSDVIKSINENGGIK